MQPQLNEETNLKNFRNLNVTVFRFAHVHPTSIVLLLLIQLHFCANYFSHFDAASPLKVLITPVLVMTSNPEHLTP